MKSLKAQKALEYHPLSQTPYTLLQLVIRVHSISRILQHHLFTIFTSHHHHQPQTPDKTLQSHNSMSLRHFKSFSTIHIDLLYCTLVTFATSHRLRSPLKVVASNTITRKDGQLHLQSTRKKRRRKEEPWSKYCDSPTKANILQTTYITPPTHTPEWTSLNHKSQEHVQVT